MISTITIKEQDKWDTIVKSFNNYDVNYLSQYAKAFAENGEGYPLLIYFENDTSKAMNVVMKRDISLNESFKGKLQPNEWFDISTPYGYGGFLIEGEDYQTLDEEYVRYCKENGFISEFIRFHLFSDYKEIFNGTVISYTNNVVRTLDLDIEDMVMDCEHKVRKNLKKANKAGLKIEIDYSGERMEEFLDIYYGTMDRNDAKSNFFFPESFFKIINEMTNNFVYIHVIHEDKVISTELVIFGTENCYSFLGGTHSDFFDLRPNDFLKVEIIKWAKDKGLRRFILGGGYGQDDGIFRYKKSFSPNGIYKFYVGNRIFDEEKYSELVKIRSSNQYFDKDTNFFPKYRA